MIALQLNKQDFEYDAHSLVRAFYPGTDVSIFYGDEPVKEPYDMKISLDYQEEEITIRFFSKEGEVLASQTEAVDYYADRKATKNHLKYRLYQMLSEYTGQKLPWGTLTGIRPTKIPMHFLEEGKRPAWIADYMRKTYLTSPEKTSLGISIAVREKDILDLPYK